MNIEKIFERISLPEELPEFEKKLIIENFEWARHFKNEVIIKENEDCDKIFFILNGAIRIFYFDELGVEVTRTFIFENEFCTNLISFSGQALNNENIQCIEDTALFFIKREKFYEMLKKSQILTEMYAKILEHFINRHLQHFQFMNTKNERQRVEYLLYNPSEVNERVKDKIIATYLKVSPEFFSRVKSEILHRK